MVRDQKSAPILKLKLLRRRTTPPLLLLYLSTAILRRSWSSWELRAEPSSGWLWVWGAVNPRPLALSRPRLWSVLGGGCHRKNQERPRPNRRTRKWIIERRMDQDSDHADSPDRANRRPDRPEGQRKHSRANRQAPFSSPLQPVRMCLIHNSSRIERGKGGICRRPTPQPPANPGMHALSCAGWRWRTEGDPPSMPRNRTAATLFQIPQSGSGSL